MTFTQEHVSVVDLELSQLPLITTTKWISETVNLDIRGAVYSMRIDLVSSVLHCPFFSPGERESTTISHYNI
jgi:hypothetical protein